MQMNCWNKEHVEPDPHSSSCSPLKMVMKVTRKKTKEENNKAAEKGQAMLQNVPLLLLQCRCIIMISSTTTTTCHRNVSTTTTTCHRNVSIACNSKNGNFCIIIIIMGGLILNGWMLKAQPPVPSATLPSFFSGPLSLHLLYLFYFFSACFHHAIFRPPAISLIQLAL